MLRRALHKIIPAYAIFPLILTVFMNFFAYQGNKLIQIFIANQTALDMTTSLDQVFPFSPVWSLVYVASYAFWVYQYITVARESPALCYQLAAADFIAKVLCFLIFIVLPTTNVRPEPEGSGFSVWLMKLIYALDTPTNLFPSMHCLVAWLGTRYIFQCKHLRHRTLISIACLLGSLLVFLSTLFTKQHVLYDVFAGVAAAEIGWLVARFTKLPGVIEKINERKKRLTDS